MGKFTGSSNTDEGDESEEKEETLVRLYDTFDRVTERIHYLDGRTTDITYDEGVVNHRRVRIEDNSVWQVIGGKELPYSKVSFEGRMELGVPMMKKGRINREQVPFIEEIDRQPMVAFVEGTHEQDYDLDNNPLFVCTEEKFEKIDDDREDRKMTIGVKL